MSNPFEDLRQAVVVRPMNSPGPQGVAGPEVKIKYSFDGLSWHDTYVEHDKYIRFSTDNGVTWSNAIYFNNLAETLEWVERARQWAENPENDPVITPDQYSALHHASRAARSEENAEAAALEAENLVSGAYGIAPPLWNRITVYNYNDIVSFDNGQVYRCIGTNIIGETHAPNINGIDNKEDWTRITAVLDGYFEVDENGDFMPMIAPTNSEIFMLDENSDITYQDPIELDASRATIELFTLDENGDIAYRDPTDHRPGGGNIELYKKTEFVNSIADLRMSSFYGTTEYVYVAGYYGAGTPGGGVFYKDIESTEADNSGTIIVDKDGIRWKRANVHTEYYASWFGISTDIDDNSPLIQNALNVIPSGSILIFESGEYRCKQTIRIPDDPDDSLFVKRITLQGAAHAQRSNGFTILRYSGPQPPTLTPFIDFRGKTGNKRFFGSILSLEFRGISRSGNLVGLWFYSCRCYTNSVRIQYFRYGMYITNHYYNSLFDYTSFANCDYGFRAESLGNSATFHDCKFYACNIGIGHALSTYGCTGIYINNCMFEGLETAIQSSLGSSLHINQCYFEGISEYMIDIFSVSSSISRALILTLENCYIATGRGQLTSNRAIIRQTLPSNFTMTLVVNNNAFYYTYDYIEYLVYVAGGDINIKAENNKIPDYAEAQRFSVSSKTPLKSSYFNNDFSDTD